MNRFKKPSVRKLILISPETYDKYKRSILIPSHTKLSEIEVNFLKIMQNEDLTPGERLYIYNNILTQKLNKSLKTIKHVEKNLENKEKIQHKEVEHKQTQFEKPKIEKISTETQYSPKKKTFNPIINSSFIEEEEEDKNIADTKNSSRFFGHEIYENFPILSESQKEKLDHRDYESEREDLYNKMMELANVSDIRDLHFDKNDLDKSFIKFKRRGSFTENAIDKNNLSNNSYSSSFIPKTLSKSIKKETLEKKKKSEKISKTQNNNSLLMLVSPTKLRSGSQLSHNKRGWIVYSDISKNKKK